MQSQRFELALPVRLCALEPVGELGLAAIDVDQRIRFNTFSQHGHDDDIGLPLDQFAGWLEDMWQDCLKCRAFGYSAHYEAAVWTLPDLFRTVKPGRELTFRAAGL
jgi:hypothetical protein